MNTLRYILAKEFRQVFRDKAMLPMIFIMPIVQLIILPLAANFEIKNINIAIVDNDHSSYSRQLISKITASGYFRLTQVSNSYNEAFLQIENDKADVVLEIPTKFETNLIRENQEKVFIAVNAINGVKGTLGGAYLNSIVQQFNSEIRNQLLPVQLINAAPIIQIRSSNWYNPHQNYKMFMVPGILVTLVTMVGVYLCSLNIVREKEIGTIEQINVTPIRKYHFILGKMIPFWLIGMFVFTVGLLGVGRLLYGIVPLGSVLLLYAFLAIYLVALLGVGLIISTYSETQQQAMSMAFFFMMIFILMSGLFTPIDSMPIWAKIIAKSIPVSYFIEVMRMVVLKGSTFRDIQYHFLIMIGFAILFNVWAIRNYKKTSS
ncbi:MAG: ABC transporter permease [Saprospiraceae bacterium]|nr:ABC transporter permease [Saprospiraceae bacterium]MBP7679709.1 ABC transporter permease [Saprospiraceae bacterium]